MERVKTPKESRVESRYIVMPQHANELGIAFGGTIMSWIDAVAAMVAQKHCESEVVTASIDQLSFLAPIRIGDHVVMRASANYVGHTSMEVGVQVMRENPFTGESARATTAYLTLVRLDREKRPAAIPQLKPETPDEIRRWENAKLRVAARKQLHERLKPTKPTIGRSNVQ